MQITFRVEGVEFGKQASEILASLSEEEKRNMAAGIVKDFMFSPEQEVVELNAYKTAYALMLRAQNTEIYSYKFGTMRAADAPDQAIMGSNHMTEHLKKFKSMRATAMEIFHEAMMSAIKQACAEYIASDEFKLVQKGVTEFAEREYPSYVHDAVVSSFARALSSTSEEITRSFFLSTNNESRLNSLEQSLRNR